MFKRTHQSEKVRPVQGSVLGRVTLDARISIGEDDFYFGHDLFLFGDVVKEDPRSHPLLGRRRERMCHGVPRERCKVSGIVGGFCPCPIHEGVGAAGIIIDGTLPCVVGGQLFAGVCGVEFENVKRREIDTEPV